MYRAMACTLGHLVTSPSKIAEAKHLFSVAHKCPFKWDSCWEILKGNPKWQDLHVVQFNTMSRDSKKMKPTLENDPIAIEGASSTPTSPGSQPATPALVLLDLDKTPTSLDTLLRERSVGREAEEDGKKETGEQIIHLSKVVEESNTLLKTFISSIDERLARSEDIARRNLHLKEEKVRQGQLEMRERQFERDRKIMDMNLDHMPPMQRQFYEMKQREICDRWKNGGQNFEKGGSSCEEHEWNGDREVLTIKCTLTHTFSTSTLVFFSYKTSLSCRAKQSSNDTIEKSNRDSLYLDKRGKLRSFNHKKLSRKKGGSLRGRGWKYGSGFVDGVFPVMSPTSQKILNFLQKEVNAETVWVSLDNLPLTHATWDDIINVVVQLRLNKQWNLIVLVCEWILLRSSFKPDVMCYNLLIDAYGQMSQYKKAESAYLGLQKAQCVPTEDTYALLLRAYCTSGLLDKAEAVLAEMRKYGLPPSVVVYNAYIDGLMKGRNTEKAVEIFQRMKRDHCQPTTDTYTMLINIYGKGCRSYMALKLFHEMKSQNCEPNICTYTALINAFAREGLCEKAEEVFEKMQEDGHEPDVYVYNALMEAYSRAGFPYGAAEIFSLMQHMGCEPDRASYNIMVDAYGRAGLHEDARSVFEELKRQGMTPTMKSHMLLLSAYSKIGDIARCEEIVNQMYKSGLKPDTFVLNSMLNSYGRMGHFTKMEEVFNAMVKGSYETDISTYNILINVYGRTGFCDKMEELFQSLPSKNLKPDVVTWTSRLGAYSRKKIYNRCIEIFEEMIDAGCYWRDWLLSPPVRWIRFSTAKRYAESSLFNRVWCYVFQAIGSMVQQVTTMIRTMHKDMPTALPI
ncbi:hypothetical protein IFM89_004435 [Coptis chinensis]|uniref:No apical meristem-associated C-terminal domain-containing protein n=1 Tax=Coptis chinensis TaxID=261450 RepID=A0A835L9Z7_9MAGN|nr:hypothetical protein IFM89_004435 [Coptis chinensis]